MEMLTESLPIVIYMLLVVLIIVLIVLGIKLLGTLSKLEKIVDNVDEKVHTLDGVFRIFDVATDKISALCDTIVNIVTKRVSKIFSKKKEESEEEYYE